MKSAQIFVGVFLFMAVLVFALTGCGSSGSSDSAWWGGGDSGGGGTTTTQVTSLTNLNNPGQPIRQGDWTQIDGTGFGATQGAGYVLYTLEDGSKGNADMYGSWSDTQITCRVPVTVSKDVSSKGTWGAQVFTDNGGSSNDFPTAGNPTPNPTPTNSPPPTASPSPTPSVSPSASPTPSVSPTPSPSPTSGGGGGGGGTPATNKWWDLGFAEVDSAITNIQVGADYSGNVYVAGEIYNPDGGNIYIFQADSGAKGLRNQNVTFTNIANVPGRNCCLAVPSTSSKKFYVGYNPPINGTNPAGTVGVAYCYFNYNSWGYNSVSNTTIRGGTVPTALQTRGLLVSGSQAYIPYDYYSSGQKVNVVNCTRGTTTTWDTVPSNKAVAGKNCTISSGTNLNLGYRTDPDNSYYVGSYQSDGSLQHYAPYVASVDANAKITTNGTTPFSLFTMNTGGSYDGFNLWYFNSGYGYFEPVGTTITSSVVNYGAPIVANGKKTVVYGSGNTVYVTQNSGSSTWTQTGTFTAVDGKFGVGVSSTGAPLVAYLTQNGGTYGIRTQTYSSTTPKIVAQREFIRATFLCCYAGVKLPMPKL